MEDALIQEIEKLRAENQVLRNEYQQRLGAKRYKLADKVVDGAYKCIHLLKPRREAVEQLKDVAPVTLKTCNKQKRSVIPGRVDIVNLNYYDWDGKEVYKGGAERYVYDLAILLERMGYQPRILQGANQAFEKDFRGFKVIGLPASCANPLELGKIYNDFCQEAEFVIASPDTIGIGLTDIPCIGINHGSTLDNPRVRIMNKLPNQLINPYWFAQEALKNLTYGVCVDTNYINWMRTRDRELSRKLVYIPNYYDEKVFKPTRNNHKDDEIVFTFPRRVVMARGYSITLKAFRNILKKYPKVKLQLVGQIHEDRAKKEVAKAIKLFPNNISHLQYSMEEAYKAYKEADVVLIPTIFSEGTSLSCIEAQASGIPVIATDVGGLPNLVIDHYNGLLIAPTAQALEQAMLECIENPELRRRMGAHAAEVAKSSFEKHLWEERWKKIITTFTRSSNESK